MLEPETTIADGRPRNGQHASVSVDLLRLIDPPRRDRDFGAFRGWPIVKVIGTGGMATVLHGFDERLHRDVAIKIVRPDRLNDPTIVERFAREARLTAQVRHGNVVVVYSVHDESLPPYLVMEFLNGGTLHDRLRQGPLSEAECIRLAKEIVAGLQAAHDLGLLHRDLKPSNIGFREPNGRVVLTDFGLARAICETDPLTEHGSPLGTPSYMSPEQVQVQKLDVRSDLFSLGTVLYQMVTGQRPFPGVDPVTTCHAIVHSPHLSAREVRPEVSAGFSALIDKLLQKNREHRYRSAGEVISALEALVQPPARRSGWLISAAAAAVIGVGGALYVWQFIVQRNDRQGGAAPAGTTVLGVAAAPELGTSTPSNEVADTYPWRTPPGEERKGTIAPLADEAFRLENPNPSLNWVNAESKLDFRPGEDRYLLLEVVAVEGSDVRWYAKLAPRSGAGKDIELNGGAEPGKFAIELPGRVLADGQTSQKVRLFTSGKAGARVTFRDVKFSDAIPEGFESLPPVEQ